MKLGEHIDVLAVMLLLAGASVVFQLEHSRAIHYGSARFVELTNREVRPLLDLHFPKLCLMRD